MARQQRRRLRHLAGLIFFGIPLGLILLVAARPVAQAIRTSHARGLARESLVAADARDWKRANEKARAALALAPAEALAAVAEARVFSAGAPQRAIAAWSALCARFPTDEGYRIELVLALARLDRGIEARELFARCTETTRAGASGRLAAGLLAVAVGDTPRAVVSLREAMRLAPAELESRWVLGRLLLAGNLEEVRKGIALLEGLQADLLFGRPARLLLVGAHQKAGDFSRARLEAEALAAAPDASVEDLLRLSSLLQERDDPAPRAALRARINALITRDRGSLAFYLAQLIERSDGRAEALTIAAELPPETRDSRILTPILARLWESAPGTRTEFRQILRSGDWTGAEHEADAYRARLAEREENPPLRAELWGRAERRAGDDPESLARLLGLARRWHWTEEPLALYPRLALRRPNDRALLEEWHGAGITARRSSAVQASCAALLAAGVNTPRIRNDFVGAALLRGQERARAAELALQNFAGEPLNPDFAATYATSLRLAGRAWDGLRVLDALDPVSAIREPVQLERAACLAALGRKAEARAIALKVPQGIWFPEEEGMLAQLRAE